MNALNNSEGILYDPNKTNSINISFYSYETTSVLPNTTTEHIPDPVYTPWQMTLVTLVLLVLIIGTIVGNCLVCIAIGIVKKLQTPSNLLILSLAVSDLLVAVLVMPFVTTYQVMGYWGLGEVVCNLFSSLDVILCTASIFNLCIISVDRYFVMTKPLSYAMKRTPKRMGLMIAGVWTSSLLLSIPPLLGWKEKNPPKYECLISQQIGYQIYATLGVFYVPLFVMIVLCYNIWRVSSRLSKEKSVNKLGSIDVEQNRVYFQNASNSVHENNLPNESFGNNSSCDKEGEESVEMLAKNSAPHQSCKFTYRDHNDTKAIKTLQILIGCFTVCWLPFFIVAVVRPFVAEDAIPPVISSVFNWLGYFNSFLNPVIYAFFNTDFRTPFKEILCLRCKNINIRIH